MNRLLCRIREIDVEIKTKNQRIDTVDEEVKDTKDRMAVMVEHLKNVQQVRACRKYLWHKYE